MNIPPRATVRLQLHKDFNFKDAQDQIAYFARLGISHLYLSPIHTARPGSMHGYDVVDYSHVNPELGGEEGFRELVSVVRQHKMGIIADLVPNHMAIGGGENRVWLDLLEWGRQSRFADFFDVDWDVQDPALRHRVHAPFLGKPYGEALADGEVKLQFDPETGRIYAGYYEHRFPIAAKDYARILRTEDATLAEPFHGLTTARATSEQPFEQARQVLAESAAKTPGVLEDIHRCLNHFDPATDAGRVRLHRVLERQHYRLAWWRTAADEINWRRFFDVIELAGLRIQDLTTFEMVHAKTFQLYQEGLIDGVRIDHVDGISDPRTYCRRLRRALTRLNHLRPEDAPKGGPYVFVEKILAPEEELSKEWQVDGDTGYSFMNEVGGLLHHPRGEQPLAEAWHELTGQPGDFETVEKRARRRTVQTMLAADFNGCAHALHKIARSRPETRDYTLLAIRRVLTEILVEFPVYRTYVDARGRSEADAEIMRDTIAAARKKLEQSSDRALMDVVDGWLGGEAPADVKPASARQARLRAIARFQQLSSPVAAKSVEDTAFYRYGPLLSRNEVGSTPLQFYLSAADFHNECRNRRKRYPHAMLATATHDHKRGEDVRARLAVLSEMPERWLSQITSWRNLNRHVKTGGPDAADEYMLYQMLVGAWPLDCDEQSNIDQFRERIAQWQEKALREAKRNSNWIEPNIEYENECKHFLQTILNAETGRPFISQLKAFVEQIAPIGAINSLTQVLLKMTAPGIPDFYQGCELWDFSFVDPDNRRPVDYALRHDALTSEQPIPDLVDDWHSGRIKQRVISTVLQVRQRIPDVFNHGRYQPLKVEGPYAGHVFCFAREVDDRVIIAAGVRFAVELATEEGKPFIPPEQWRDTRIVLPKRWHAKQWQNPFTGQILAGRHLPARWLFEQVTVALLADNKEW